jgi:hypothetical protein
MSDFSRPIGSRDNYSGFELGLGFSWLFGKGESERASAVSVPAATQGR